MKNIQIKVEDEPKIFEDLLGKIVQRMKGQAEDEKESLNKLHKTGTDPK